MRVLDVGGSVFLLRFLPDGRRLLAGTADRDNRVSFGVWKLDGGAPVRPALPKLDVASWRYGSHYGHGVAIHPNGKLCYLAWTGRLCAFDTAGGQWLPVPTGIEADQVVLSPDGGRLLVATITRSDGQVVAASTGRKRGKVIWEKTIPRLAQLAGFLPDGERFVTLDGAVRIRSFETGDELRAGRVRPRGTEQPQISPDGRFLGVFGYRSLHLYDLTTLGAPRKIRGGGVAGDFRSFAFHPSGKTVAVIHGGPTMVKVYDVETLRRVETWTWKVGPLGCVAFSSDGLVGAAGSEDGRVVVWDVEG